MGPSYWPRPFFGSFFALSGPLAEKAVAYSNDTEWIFFNCFNIITYLEVYTPPDTLQTPPRHPPDTPVFLEHSWSGGRESRGCPLSHNHITSTSFTTSPFSPIPLHFLSVFYCFWCPRCPWWRFTCEGSDMPKVPWSSLWCSAILMEDVLYLACHNISFFWPHISSQCLLCIPVHPPITRFWCTRHWIKDKSLQLITRNFLIGKL